MKLRSLIFATKVFKNFSNTIEIDKNDGWYWLKKKNKYLTKVAKPYFDFSEIEFNRRSINIFCKYYLPKKGDIIVDIGAGIGTEVCFFMDLKKILTMQSKLHIIYTFRNRDLVRIDQSLKSLQKQSVKDFEVHFVDYGSEAQLAKEIEVLVNSYGFANFKHYATYHQPWNKSRALNSVIKHLSEGYCFVADIDMIFHKDFVKAAISLQNDKTAVYFQVGFLNEKESLEEKPFEAYKIDFESTYDATGLTMFPIGALQAINGFDEFYHFWGAEDTDVHVRLKHAGYAVQFYDQQLLMLHQWHPSYRSKESKKLSRELRLTNAVKLNHEHLKLAKNNNNAEVNQEGWGNPLTRESYEELIGYISEEKILSTKKEIIDHFLFHDLAMINHEIRSFIIKPHTKPKSIKDYLKKMLGKSQAHFYSLKEVNDLILMQIVTTYRNYDYTLEADITRNEIRLKIRKSKLHA